MLLVQIEEETEKEAEGGAAANEYDDATLDSHNIRLSEKLAAELIEEEEAAAKKLQQSKAKAAKKQAKKAAR